LPYYLIAEPLELSPSTHSRLPPLPPPLLARARSNPKKRISAKQALEHPYVAPFHNEAQEREASGPVHEVIPDNEKKSTSVYRERLYHEITKNKKKYGAEPGMRLTAVPQ